MSKSTKSTESISRYEAHYSRLRELQAERKAFKAVIDKKIADAQQEYREYLEKYKAARKESEAAFFDAAKPKAEKPEAPKAEKKAPAKKVLKKAAAKNPAAKKA